MSRFGGSATIVPASDYVSRFARTGLSRISSAHFSTIHDTAQKAASAKAEAAFFGMGSKGERFGAGSWSVARPSSTATQKLARADRRRRPSS
jgi:hypothetical protein